MKISISATRKISRKFASLSVLVIAGIVAVSFTVVPHATADQYDEQIKQLQQQNAGNQSAVSELQGVAATYQDTIRQLQSQINVLQSQISDNRAKQADIQAKIVQSQLDIDRQKQVLGENIRVMYVEGQITTIEMLATSKNLSDFVDKEEYHTAVKNKIQVTLKEIATLQNQLKEQKTQVENLLADQKSQQGQLDASRAQQASLLAYNASQQNAYNAQIDSNKSKISDLRKQQMIENSRLSGGKVIGGKACDSGNGDTYPSVATNAYGGKWGCSFALDNTIDNWGMYNRECVSYTAWKVHESGRNMPYWGGRGNAKQWDDNARAANIPVSTTPQDGDVAIKNGGEYGHALYVEHAYGDGSILVSDYNQQYDGVYRRYTISASTVAANNLQFIHF